jgi:hypothetical protein
MISTETIKIAGAIFGGLNMLAALIAIINWEGNYFILWCGLITLAVGGVWIYNNRFIVNGDDINASRTKRHLSKTN